MEFEIEGLKYKTMRMDTFVQLDVVRRLMPLLASGAGEFVPMFMEFARKGVKVQDIPVDRLMELLPPVSRELAKMTDADQRYVIGACLDCVRRENVGAPGWAKVWSAEAKRAMFQDINDNLGLLMRIVLVVLQEKFAPFLPAKLSSLIGVVRV